MNEVYRFDAHDSNNLHYHFCMTHVALLTPYATGAISTIAVSGANAWSIAQSMFQRANQEPLPASPRAGEFWYGRAGGPQGDEVILAVPSTAPEVWTEYHCHGGVRVTKWLLHQFVRCGARPADGFGLLTHRLITKYDGAALPHLAAAQTLRTASILLDQYHGAVRRAFEAILVDLARKALPELLSRIASLLRFDKLALHLTQPWRVVVAGLPNVGKSSLVNALAGYQRSVVTAIPGTTRDVVTTTLAFRGWPVELADTAGLRDAVDAVEREGVQRAREQLRQADLCLWVLDSVGADPGSMADFLQANQLSEPKVLVVLNKSDLSAQWDTSRFPEAVAVSARTGDGIGTLIDRIIHRLIPEEPEPGAAVPYSEPMVESLRKLQRGLLE